MRATGITANDWLGYGRFRPGVYVVEKDGRLDHAARITAIHPQLTASVIYVATGHRGELSLETLETVAERIAREEGPDA
jgi:hypothetical protein